MLLLTPGPTPVPGEIAEAMRRPVVPHRGPEFSELLARVRPRLAELFRTRGPVLAFAGSGTSAVETAMWSLLRPGETTCSISVGRFGERWADSLDRFAARHGGERRRVHAEWGGVTDPDRLAESLDPGVRLVSVVQSETSTGALTDLREIVRIVRDRAPDALVVADVVTGVGAIELETDAWGVDAAAAASQKALMLPPGLALVALGERAIRKLRTTEPLLPISADLRWRLDAFERGTIANTPPIAHWFGLERSLEMILPEGLERRWSRVADLAEFARRELLQLGFTLAAERPVAGVTAVRYPPGLDDRVRERCRAHGVALAGGQDAWAGRVIRMSHMGAVDRSMTEAGLDAIRQAISETNGTDAPAGRR